MSDADPGQAHWRYALGLGSNRGDREATITQALTLLAQEPAVRLVARSRLHQTAPIGGPAGQGPYLNGAAIVATSLGPHQLLARLQAVETQLGRTRTVAWGPRTIDLDLLLRDDGLVVHSPQLTMPHPRLHQRGFVLLPLSEIAEAWNGGGGVTVGTLARAFAAAPAG